MKIGSIVGEHIRGRQQLHRCRDLSPIDGSSGEFDLSFPVGHWCRYLGAFVALGECSGQGGHGGGSRLERCDIVVNNVQPRSGLI